MLRNQLPVHLNYNVLAKDGSKFKSLDRKIRFVLFSCVRLAVRYECLALALLEKVDPSRINRTKMLILLPKFTVQRSSFSSSIPCLSSSSPTLIGFDRVMCLLFFSIWRGKQKREEYADGFYTARLVPSVRCKGLLFCII